MSTLWLSDQARTKVFQIIFWSSPCDIYRMDVVGKNKQTDKKAQQKTGEHDQKGKNKRNAQHISV